MGTNDLLSIRKLFYNISKVIRHKDHNKPNLANDIALIKINGTIKFNENVQPIELNPNEIDENETVVLSKFCMHLHINLILNKQMSPCFSWLG